MGLTTFNRWRREAALKKAEQNNVVKTEIKKVEETKEVKVEVNRTETTGNKNTTSRSKRQ